MPLSLLLGTSTATAQIVTDGTVGLATSLSGPEMTIGAELGSTRGANLFHSFQRFDIPTGQRATFTGPEQIRNVIGRVTGGQTSNIDGTLRSTVGQADVYLINPSGIVMGPNAQVDVPAALHLSTADELRFDDGSRYSARDPANSTLTLAAPESFGFLSPQPASLTITGSQLELKPGKTATLTAGDVRLTETAERRAALKAPGGEIRIEAVGAEPAVVPVATPSPTPGGGQLVITQTDLNTSGNGGGRLIGRAGEAVISDSQLRATNLGETPSIGGIDLDIRGSLQLDRSQLLAHATGQGAAGDISVSVGDRLEILAESMIASATFGAGDSGTVAVQSGTAYLDGAGTTGFTGITSSAQNPSSGHAGSVAVEVDGLLEVLHGAMILTTTWSSGNAGAVDVRAGSARLVRSGSNPITGIASDTGTSSGHAGAVDVVIDGTLALTDGAVIRSNTSGSGDGGTVSVAARSLSLNGAGSESATGIKTSAQPGSTGRAGGIVLDIAESLEILNGSEITSSTFASGDAGTLNVRTGSAHLNGAGADGFTGIATGTQTGSTGNAGDLRLEVAGALDIRDGAVIYGGTQAAGNAGSLSIQAASAHIDRAGSKWVTGIASDAADSTGKGGRVEIDIDGLLEVRNGGVIRSNSFAAGAGGDVVIRAGSMRLDRAGAERVTGIVSDAASTGHAGSVSIEVADFLEMLNSAEIRSNTSAQGDAGRVSIDVGGLLSLWKGPAIQTSTFGPGKAGNILVRASAVRLDRAGSDEVTGIASDAAPASSGPAGTVTLEVDGGLEVLDGALISSTTFGEKAAGTIRIHAGSARLDGGGVERFTGIVSSAEINSMGPAGEVVLEIDGLLEVRNGALIATNTFSAGDAGTLSVRAGALRLDNAGSKLVTGIVSSAETGSAGRAGEVILDVRGRLDVLDGARISVMSNGRGEAGDIRMKAEDLRLVNGGRITTEASQADAGSITIGGGRLWLTDSLITTSANGTVGDGGDIELTPEYLILDGGFIQANTAAVGARGGDIRIDTRALVTSEGLVEIGGLERQTFTTDSDRNIIQAAAPGGEQGTIDVTSPELDITAALVSLTAAFDDPNDLLTDLCQGVTGSKASSLVERGAGGLPPTPFAPASVSFMGERLDRVRTP